MKNKNIKVIAAIGNRPKALKRIRDLAENCNIIENRVNLIEGVRSLEETTGDNESTIKNVFKNKTGKYIVFSKETAQMEEDIEKAKRIFGESKLKIYTTQKGIEPIKNDNIINKFCQKKKNDNKMELLFINKFAVDKCDLSNIDGIIILSPKKVAGRKDLDKLHSVLENCPEDFTIVQAFDDIDIMRRYNTFKNELEQRNFDDNIEFIETNDFKSILKFRSDIYSDRINDKERLEIMKQYKKETGKDITADVVYKGYKIGVWKNNYRQAYLNKILKMDEEVLQEFIDEGILGDRKRNERRTDLDKFQLFMDYHQKNPKAIITDTTIDEKGNPLGKYRAWLQIKVNRGTTDLSKEQINQLLYLGYLNLTQEEKENVSKQYNIPIRKIDILIRKYKNIEDFIKLYKIGKAENEGLKLNKRGIILSKNELSKDKKQKYLNLIDDIYGDDILKDSKKFILEEEIQKGLSKLSENQRKVILKNYGLDGNSPQKLLYINLGNNLTRQRVCQIRKQALDRLKNEIKIYSIEELNASKEKLKSKKVEINNLTDTQWKRKVLNISIDKMKISKGTIERLKQKGYSKMSDFLDVTKFDLLNISGIGEGKARIILNQSKNLKIMSKREKIRQIEQKIENIDSLIEPYKKAHDYYIEKENIFSLDGTIPPFIKPKKITSLNEKREEKAKKQKVSNSLDEQIKQQDDKTDKLKSVLESEGIDLYLEIKNKEG